jgi:xylan 1,4-beta-xylosidase
MNKMISKAAVFLLIVTWIAGMACSRVSDEPSTFSARITDKPMTFCNPISLDFGSERSRRAGEPILVLHKDDYYLFVSGGRGYWYSDNMRDWIYVEAPNLPTGCPSVISWGDTLYFSGDKTQRDLYASIDPRNGVWDMVATFEREYGDAAMFLDDDDRVYMYWGWSQIEPIQVVELDPNNGFKEIGEPATCFFGNEKVHGWERRRNVDLKFTVIRSRPYVPEAAPWIEGPWMIKHNGKYYLQYAAVGIEFSTYSHGIYVSDNPLGPFEYCPHNPLSFKPTGFIPGAGHGNTFQDKNGDFWVVGMFASFYAGRGRGEIGIYPAAIDDDGVLHCNTEFGDYPQYFPGIRENPVRNNFAGWTLLSHKKYAEASSALEGYGVENAVDEDVFTYWCAKSGDPGEFIIVDLGQECEIHSLQVNFDEHNASEEFTQSIENPRYQSYTVHVSDDNENWSMVIDKSYNTMDIRHDYTELTEAIKARYVKLTNLFTPGDGKFAVKGLRVFGNPEISKFKKVDDVMIVRDQDDRRNASLMWQPVSGADGYIVRYGIKPDKLYNNYMVYDSHNLSMHALNRDTEYHFMVEAFDSGTDFYRENYQQTIGRGIDLELFRDGEMLERKMIYAGMNEHVFEDILPGQYRLRHAHGPTLWKEELTEVNVIGTGDVATLTEALFDIGKGEEVLGELVISVYPGVKSGKFVVTFQYHDQQTNFE